MSGLISFNPYTTSQPNASFMAGTQGYVQGTAYDDPSVRMELTGGYLASAATTVIWGGVPVSEYVNNTGTGADGVGSAVIQATSQANVTGFTVYNQAGSMVITTGPSAPVAGIGNYVPFFRYNSNIRIAVNCDPALITAIQAGVLINSQALYWDVTNYRITLTTTGGNFALPTSTELLSTNGNSKIVTYSSGVANWAAGSAAIIKI